MSSIDTYSTTKDLAFDEASYKSDEIVIEVYFGSCFFFCPLDYPVRQILDLGLPRDCEKMFDLANIHGYLDVYVGHNPQVILLDLYFKPLEVVYEYASTSNGKVMLDDIEDVANGRGKVVFDESKDGLI
nr:hypothetical protein [Tanacetum cinerariifolium]